MEGHGHCQSRAGVCWAGGEHTVLHHHGGIGLEIITQRAEQGQGPCNLEVWMGRSKPLAIPGHDFFQKPHDYGSSARESGVNYRAVSLMSRALCLGLALGRLQDLGWGTESCWGQRGLTHGMGLAEGVKWRWSC